MMRQEEYKNILIKYIPEAAFEQVYALMMRHGLRIVVTRHRKSKHGDFRPGVKGKPSIITINHSLNPFAFLITLLHEAAHQLVWEKYKRSVSPHGPEWKKKFHELLQPFVLQNIFPDGIASQLEQDHLSIKYSTSVDLPLARQLKEYDKPRQGLVLLETLPNQTQFRLPDGKEFIKLSRRRKNFLCVDVANQRQYIFNPLAEVIAVNKPNDNK
ncbi:MAG: hypothetical protein RBR47_12630 [Bacteroidales bacterium]|nr:SprT-like domain-containing protein [Bacteroidales bacterium]MDD2632869.1 hypothetical protein [Bacteroidales bacterium]MDY0335794.1 hypothetical protein [Bacteroidales bacterium]NCU36462.1 sprT domain-containing protein [Candidatus Falkowbacteria bacterium]NLO51400.1 SprT family zinc-dependent metalloprotease [Bacteroidales bacterium]